MENPYDEEIKWTLESLEADRKYSEEIKRKLAGLEKELSEIFVRIEEPQQRKAIPVQFDTYFYSANQVDQPSPFPELHRTFWVTIKAKAWKYEHHDFGEYPEAWRVGLLSDILHSIMYNRGKDMTEGEWKLWRIPEYENKVDVRLPEKRKRGIKVIQSFVGLVQEIEDAFTLAEFIRELGGGE